MPDEISPLDNRPWIPRPIPQWLAKELSRRRNDIGINYPSTNLSKWDKDGNWNTYKGPLTPWVRFCSNGNGKNKVIPGVSSQIERDGFILYGGNGAKDTFGLDGNKTILGYEVNGNPHIIPMSGGGFNYTTPTFNDDGTTDNITVPMYLPSPGIIQVEALLQKQFIREATIKWTCHGAAQLNYMTPYFLTPRITVILEFGWNHYNPRSLLNLSMNNKQSFKVLSKDGKEIDYKYQSAPNKSIITDIGLRELWQDGTPLYNSNVRLSNGMYDVIYGIICNFEFSSVDGIKWDCSTTIGSKHRNFGGVGLDNQNIIHNITSKEEGENKRESDKQQALTFPNFVDVQLKNIKQAVTNGDNFFDISSSKSNVVNNSLAKFAGDFYGGCAENRAFFGRTDVPLTSGENAAVAGDWDVTSNGIWVTMGFLMEMFNFFFTKSSNSTDSTGNTFKFYKIKSDGKTMIGAHPNLISTDGSILLIPNAKSPKYNNRLLDKENIINQYDNQSLDEFNSRIYLESFKTKKEIRPTDYFYNADNELRRTFKTGKRETGDLGVARDNVDMILNAHLYGRTKLEKKTITLKRKINQGGENSFPQYRPSTNTDAKLGYYGYLEDLYINVDHILSVIKSTNTVEEFYKELLTSLNEAVSGFWDLHVVEGYDTLTIIDQKFRPHFSEPIYQFDILSSRNVIKNIAFTAIMSNAQANQVIAGTTNNKTGDGEESTSPISDFVYGDRLFKDLPNPSQVLSLNNFDVIRQLQTPGKDGAYIMTFFYTEDTSTVQSLNLSQYSAFPVISVTKSNKSTKNVVNLVLPNKALLTSILSDNDREKNINMYGGQQRNFILELTLQGIAGFQTFQCFSIKNFPRPYSDKDVIFQIVDIVHTLTNNSWETKIKASIRPFKTTGEQLYTDGSNLY